MAKEYQAVEKARRASEHNDSLSRQENAPLPQQRVNESSEGNPEDARDTDTSVSESPKSLLESGDRVWLSVREFLLKWVGYDEPTWEPMTNLSCGGLLYDYLREKRSSQRFQMVQVADEN
ncbi:unnamed protein product [Phytophthora fragariaefolia]|uniref:Unnamed protein product n=1 Tax=Phytophthora fragariaefolia TaxID=1490495 RepID=A0A9W6X4E1_9STRA|nr:unnamed protein product [Phytophthora fragariaefolia]